MAYNDKNYTYGSYYEGEDYCNPYMVDDYISTGYYVAGENCSLSTLIVCTAAVDVKGSLNIFRKVAIEAKASLTIFDSSIASVDIACKTSSNIESIAASQIEIIGKATVWVRAVPENMLEWMSQINACCYNQNLRLEAVETAIKEFLIPKDIEPLFSGREVHYDV